jgi:hypothetical protein
MDELVLAIQGDSFARNSEDLIRKKFPKQISFTVKLPAKGKGTSELTVTLNTTPYRISAAVQDDGKVYVHAEIQVYLASIAHSVLINDIFPAGHLIPTTSVRMKSVPPMPLTHVLDHPVLIGVPGIDVRVSKTTQNVLDGKRIQLNADIGPGQIYVTLNFPGLLQVLIQKLTDANHGRYQRGVWPLLPGRNTGRRSKFRGSVAAGGSAGP